MSITICFLNLDSTEQENWFHWQPKPTKSHQGFRTKLEKHLGWFLGAVKIFVLFQSFYSRKPFYNFFHFFKKVSKNETRRLRFIWTKKKIGCGGKWRRRRLGKVGDDKNDCLRWQHDWAFLQFLKREGWSNQMQAYVGLLWNRVFPKLLNWDFEFRGLLLIKINNWKLRRLNFCYSPCLFVHLWCRMG